MHDNYWVNGYYIFYLNNKQGINVKSQKKENVVFILTLPLKNTHQRLTKLMGELINNLNNKST